MDSELSDEDIDELLADSGSEYEPENETFSESEFEVSFTEEDYATNLALKKEEIKNNREINPSSADKKNQINGLKKNRQSEKRNQTTDPSNAGIPKKIKVEKKVRPRLEKPFQKLLDGVIFVISGFQNPLRGEIRSKALEMGAKYKVDWDKTCTHLICAFMNTPKFNQVKNVGKIVKKEWIEECHKRRMRLSWRRYALDKNDLSTPMSEEEIYEEVATPVPVDHRRTTNISESENTDDEIERVRHKQKLNNNKQPRSLDESEPSTSKISIYDMDTDIDESDEPEQRKFPPLPEIFNGLTFFLMESLTKDEKIKLRRYIIAYKGRINDDISKDTKMIIGEDYDVAQKMKTDFPNAITVKPTWVWRSSDEKMRIETTSHEL